MFLKKIKNFLKFSKILTETCKVLQNFKNFELFIITCVGSNIFSETAVKKVAVKLLYAGENVKTSDMEAISISISATAES